MQTKSTEFSNLIAAIRREPGPVSGSTSNTRVG